MSLKNWLETGSLKRKSGDGKHNFKVGVSKVSPQQRTRVQMSPEAQNDI
jgi:hypothetical protein